MCVCGGGGYLSQVRKMPRYLDFSEDLMFGLKLANTYFQLSQTETFRLINVIMKL